MRILFFTFFFIVYSFIASSEIVKEVITNNNKRISKESIISFKVNKINTKYNDPFLVDLIDISFDVKEGEIFGIAGIAGNGQSELMNVLTGEETLQNPSNIEFYENNIANLGPKERRNLSIAFVPEDRLGHSAIPQMSLIENVLLSQYGGNDFSKWGIINKKSVIEKTKYLSVVEGTFNQPSLNAFMEMGASVWKETRNAISRILVQESRFFRENPVLLEKALVDSKDAKMHLPLEISDYTDFYSSR